jgi:hypothetical protein
VFGIDFEIEGVTGCFFRDFLEMILVFFIKIESVYGDSFLDYELELFKVVCGVWKFGVFPRIIFLSVKFSILKNLLF